MRSRPQPVLALISPSVSRILFLVLAILAFLVGPESSFAQKVPYTNNTADAGLRSEMKVDPSTLALSFELSLGTYPGRGGDYNLLHGEHKQQLSR